MVFFPDSEFCVMAGRPENARAEKKPVKAKPLLGFKHILRNISRHKIKKYIKIPNNGRTKAYSRYLLGLL